MLKQRRSWVHLHVWGVFVARSAEVVRVVDVDEEFKVESLNESSHFTVNDVDIKESKVLQLFINETEWINID